MSKYKVLCLEISEAFLPPRSMREDCLSRWTVKSCLVNLPRLTIGRVTSATMNGDDCVDGAVE